MISSTVWVRLVLSPASLQSVSSVAPCSYVAVHCSVPNEWSIALVLCYSHTVATCVTVMHDQSC
jgi:hypothetical protein